MATDFSRREFLALSAAAAAAVGITACGGSDSTPTTVSRRALPAPDDAPFDTVVILMMENRSFDHFLGWLPGADGRQVGLSYRDTDGGSRRG